MTTSLKEGRKAPAITLPDQDGTKRKLDEWQGKWVLLFFYPKDDTPGCTAEACALRDRYTALKRAGAEVIGISVDPVESHRKFADKHALPFTLLADEQKKVVERYGVWGPKKFMGRSYEGTHRVSFLIDPDGRIARVYPKVKPAEHAGQVLADLKALKASRG